MTGDTASSKQTAPYTMRRVEELLGLSRTAVLAFVKSGFVSPGRDAEEQPVFTLHDVIVMRAADRLRHASITRRKLFASLKTLRERLPGEIPMSGLRLRAIGGEIAVRGSDENWETAAGQLLFEFEVTAVAGTLTILTVAAPPSDPGELFQQALDAELEDTARAQELYRRLIERDPRHENAYLNLGALLCDEGRCGEAVDLYRTAVEQTGDSASLRFNAAMALEDLGRLREALDSYEASIAIDPEFADAHFNAARLEQQLGNLQGAIRHFSAYRRLTGELGSAL